MQRFEQIGAPDHEPHERRRPVRHDPIAGVLGDRDKRALAAQLLGQAYVTRLRPDRRTTRTAVEKIADALVERSELFGDELVELLDEREAADAARST